MRVPVRSVGKGVVVGVLVALIASGCSGEVSRSAQGVDEQQADASATPDARTSSSATPSGTSSATPSASGASADASDSALASDGAVGTSADDAASVPEPGASPEGDSSEGAGQRVGATGGVTCPSRAPQCQAWPERPASEGWVQDVVCPSSYSMTWRIGVRNLSTVPVILGVRHFDCYDWSVTGNPAQITGTLLSNGQATPTWWLLEPANWADYPSFNLGVFLKNPDGTLDFRGTMLFRSGGLSGEVLYATNTGRPLEPYGLYGTRCRRASLGPDPNQWKTRQEFNWRLNAGEFSPQADIYSDGANLYIVRCFREGG